MPPKRKCSARGEGQRKKKSKSNPTTRATSQRPPRQTAEQGNQQRRTRVGHQQTAASQETETDNRSDTGSSTSGNSESRHIDFPNLENFDHDQAQPFTHGVDIEEYSPPQEPSFLDNVGSTVPQKIKEKIWAGKFIDLATLLKPEREAINELESGDLRIKNHKLVLEHTKNRSYLDIEDWTSAFIIFMSVMLEKFRTRAQELLKYMRDIRLASKRSNRFGWGAYDEQYRLRKERDPHSSWGVINHEYWLLYVNSQGQGRNEYHTYSYPKSYPQNQSFGQNHTVNSSQSFQPGNNPNINNRTQKRDHTQNNLTPKHKTNVLYCRFYNQGTDCHFYPRCRYLHLCDACGGKHRRTQCNRSFQQGR